LVHRIVQLNVVIINRCRKAACEFGRKYQTDCAGFARFRLNC
jgi:hypothetical protein